MGTITPESFSIFRYGLLSQKDQRCSPVICAKEKEKSLNIKKDSKEKKNPKKIQFIIVGFQTQFIDNKRKL